MDPGLKAYLDKMSDEAAARTNKMSDEAAARANKQDGNNNTILQALATQSAWIDSLVTRKPEMEARFAQLELSVAALQAASSSMTPSDGSPPPATPPTVAREIQGQPCRGATLHTGDPSLVTTASPVTTPVTSMAMISSQNSSPLSSQVLNSLGQTPPPMTFPVFAGENPQLWKTLCEQYFQMFSVHDSYWVPMSILNFSGPAAIGLQSVQRKIAGLNWESFTALLCTRFGRDKHQLLIRQFYAIRQTHSVADFIKRFETLMNHMISYSVLTHPYFFLTRFIEGLHADIRVVVLIQRPPDLDTACSLVLLQEEVADGEATMRASFNQAPAARWSPPSATSSPVAIPQPTAPAVSAEDRRGTDAVRAALRTFRRARGLCFKCGERWGKDHTCPATVQMHIVEELLALFGPDEDALAARQPECTKTEDDNLCILSSHAVAGSDGPGVMQLHAWLQGREVLLLVDSESTSSFVDQRLAARLKGVSPLPKACKVKVVDGAMLICDSFLPQCQWVCQGQEFVTDFKVISLGVYYAILGMDWLKQHSPMYIDWEAHHLSVTTTQGAVELQAVT